MATAIRAEAMMDKICAAFDVPPSRVRRIVLDLQLNSRTAVYIEFVGDTRMLEIDWPHFGPDDFDLHRSPEAKR